MVVWVPCTHTHIRPLFTSLNVKANQYSIYIYMFGLCNMYYVTVNWSFACLISIKMRNAHQKRLVFLGLPFDVPVLSLPFPCFPSSSYASFDLSLWCVYMCPLYFGLFAIWQIGLKANVDSSIWIFIFHLASHRSRANMKTSARFTDIWEDGWRV